MKKFTKLFLTVVSVLAATVLMFGCASYDYGAGGGYADGDYYPSGGYDEGIDVGIDGGDGYEEGETGEVGSGSTEGDKNEGQKYEAGLMTAGAHNDNLYYDLYKSLFFKGQTDAENGKFLSFTGEKSWGLDTLNRIKVTVTNGDDVVCNAKVVFTDGEGNMIYGAQTDSSGVAYLFGNNSGGTVTVYSGTAENSVSVLSEDDSVEVTLSDSDEKAKAIEIMLVVDVTGSMGDELRYLKNELGDVVNRIASSFTDTRVSLSILFYRDHTDSEIFSYSDFSDVTNSDNLATKQAFIAKQTATGGGDYEEAVDEALELAVSKQWSDNATKVLFHVLDAPPHSGQTYETRYKNATLSAAEKGIRICPILASGADTTTEYLMRQAAVMTGGTFSFITDHSGIGGGHLDPEIPNVVIEKLNDLMVRLVKGYYTGEFENPVCYNGKTYYTLDTANVEKGFILSGAKRAYASGDTVTLYTKNNGLTTYLYVDGVKTYKGEEYTETIYVTSGEVESYYVFKFTMPNKNVAISFEALSLSEDTSQQ